MPLSRASCSPRRCSAMLSSAGCVHAEMKAAKTNFSVERTGIVEAAVDLQPELAEAEGVVVVADAGAEGGAEGHVAVRRARAVAVLDRQQHQVAGDERHQVGLHLVGGRAAALQRLHEGDGLGVLHVGEVDEAGHRPVRDDVVDPPPHRLDLLAHLAPVGGQRQAEERDGLERAGQRRRVAAGAGVHVDLQREHAGAIAARRRVAGELVEDGQRRGTLVAEVQGVGEGQVRVVRGAVVLLPGAVAEQGDRRAQVAHRGVVGAGAARARPARRLSSASCTRSAASWMSAMPRLSWPTTANSAASRSPAFAASKRRPIDRCSASRSSSGMSEYAACCTRSCRRSARRAPRAARCATTRPCSTATSTCSSSSTGVTRTTAARVPTSKWCPRHAASRSARWLRRGSRRSLPTISSTTLSVISVSRDPARGPSSSSRRAASKRDQPLGVQHLQELADEERVAAGLARHHVGERRGLARRLAQGVGDEQLDVGRPRAAARRRVSTRAPRGLLLAHHARAQRMRRRHLVVAVGADQQQATRASVGRQQPRAARGWPGRPTAGRPGTARAGARAARSTREEVAGTRRLKRFCASAAPAPAPAAAGRR